MTKERRARDYAVGYGKPPKGGQFKKGKSGNPKGRPKGSRNKGSIIRNIIDRKVVVRENGKERKTTVFEAAMEKLVATGLNGTMNDLIKLVQLIEKHTPDKFEDERNAVPTEITVNFVKSDGNGRPARRADWQDHHWESHKQDVEARNNAPQSIAAWKAAGLDDDDKPTGSRVPPKELD